MFTENLKYLRKKYELQQNELAARLGYTDATISQWEHGASVPRHKALIKLSKIFNVFIDDLLYSDLTTNKEQKTGNSVRIKVFGSVPAGIPTEAIEDIVDWEEIPKEWTFGNREYFGIKVKGDSMFPKYMEGDTVIVRKQPFCESGQDCVVYVNGYDATLKKVIIRDDQYILQPLNPMYEPAVYNANDTRNPILIAGVNVTASFYRMVSSSERKQAVSRINYLFEG